MNGKHEPDPGGMPGPTNAKPAPPVETAIDLSAFTDYNREQVDLIKNTVAKGVTDNELKLFLMICRRTNLDPFARQIHAVKRWDKKANAEIMTIQTGIDGFRLISERSGKYDGQDEPLWCGKDGKWVDVWLSDDFPAAAKVVVWKKGIPRGFVGIAVWEEYVQTYTKDGKVYNAPMWNKMPAGQLAKCAEALAHRKAFPQETSGLHTDEEMAQADNQDKDEEAPEDRTGDYKIQPKEIAAPAPLVQGPVTIPVAAQPAPAPAIADQPTAQAAVDKATQEAAPTAEPTKRGRKGKAEASNVTPISTPAQAADPGPPTVAAPKADYLIYTETPAGLVKVITEAFYSDLAIASPRAQKLANDTGLPHVVVVLEEGKPITKFRAEKQEPVPEPPAKPDVSTAAKRMEALAEFMNVPIQTANVRFSNFFCGFLNIPDIKQLQAATKEIPAATKTLALDALEYAVHRDAERFNSGPMETGKAAGDVYRGVREYADKTWKGLAADLAWRVAIKWGFTIEHFKKWVDSNSIDFLNEADAGAFFRLCMRTRNAYKIVKSAADHKLQVAAMVEQMEKRALFKSLEQSTEADVDKAIEYMLRAVHETVFTAKPETAAPKAETPAPPTDTEPDQAETADGPKNDWNLFA